MKKRIQWIDIAKGIAILAVIIGHTVPHRGYFKLLWSFIFSFHMPLFFIVSGYLFNESSFKGLIIKSFKRMIVPYLITFGTYSIYVAYTCEGSFISSILKSLISIVYGSGKAVETLPCIQSIGALWFLVALFFSTILFNLVLKIVKDKDRITELAIVIGLGIMGYLLKDIKYLPWSIDLVLVSQLFMYVGYELKSMDKGKIKISNIGLICLVSLWFLCINKYAFDLNQRAYRDFTISIAGSISGSIVIFYISQYISRLDYLNRFLTFCGRESLVILCIHFLEYRIINWYEIFKFTNLNEASTLVIIVLNISKLLLIIMSTRIVVYLKVKVKSLLPKEL